MLTAIPWRLLYFLLVTFHFRWLPFCHANRSSSGVDVEHISRLWYNFEDVLNLRRVGYTGNVPELPNDLHRDLLKVFTFPTAVSTSANVSKQCVEDSLFYVENLLIHGSEWAIKMLETSGQFPAGVVGAGNHHAEGLFDECQTIRSDPYRFRGKYCTIFFKLMLLDQSEIENSVTENDVTSPALAILRSLYGASTGTVKIQPKLSLADGYTTGLNFPSLSVCLPSSCSASDLGQSIAEVIGSYVIGNNQSIVTIADENFCFTDDQAPPPIDGPTIIVILVLVMIGVLVLSATIHEAYRKHHGIDFDNRTDSNIVSILHCFSALKNSRKLLSFKPPPTRSENFSCIHGIRLLSTCWVIATHSALKISAIGKSYLLNPNTVEHVTINDYPLRIVTNATVAVDTFFMMSGFLMAYFFLKELDRRAGKFNIGVFYLLRYLRLTPVYAIVIAVTATLAVHLGKGPTWYNVVLGAAACRKNWWQHVLYINNLFPFDPNNLCMVDTWYLAAEMQLYLIAPILIYIMWRWKKAGLCLFTMITLGSIVANVIPIVHYKLPPTLIPTILNQEAIDGFINYMDHVYFQSWTRSQPYWIGVLTGWLSYRFRNSKLQLSLWLVALMWTLSMATISSVINGIVPFIDGKSVSTVDWTANVMYGSLHRMAWALAIAWIIFSCTRGYGGVANRILSWKGFFPLSRLTYCVYLVQFNYINLFYALSRKMVYFTVLNEVTTVFGFALAVFGLAFVVSLVFEGPFLSLLKLAFASKSDKYSGSTIIPAVNITDKLTENAENRNSRMMRTETFSDTKV